MDPSQADSREYQRQAIDAKIKCFEESIPELRYRGNALAPISSLPIEVIEGIFSYLRVPLSPFTPGEKPEKRDPLAWLRVTHVCHHWREIALNQPLFWSHVNFANVSWAGAVEILSRAKSVPLSLDASIPRVRWNDTRFATFQEELQRRISHIRRLGISAAHPYLFKTLQALVSPAPTLEQLSLSTEESWPRTFSLPDTLFNGITPRLSCLKLRNCDIGWELPILKGLTYLEIRSPSRSARPDLATWLDSLEDMSQLRTLIVHSASPIAPFDALPPFDVKRTTTLSFLARFDILASPRDCTLALAHLDLPALAHLSVTTRFRSDSELQRILPYVTLHSHGPQDTQPLQSMLIYSNGIRIDMLAWTAPDIEFDMRDSSIVLDTILSARVSLSITRKESSPFNIYTRMFDAAFAGLPLDSLVTFTAPEDTWFDEQVWRSHAKRWHLLHCARLGLPAAQGFRRMFLDDDGEHECSLFPSLRKLVLVDSTTVLTGPRTRDLCDVLMKRKEQGVPLNVVDMRTCIVSDHAAIQQLTELGVDVWGPTDDSSEKRKPSFAKCFSEGRDLLDQLVQDNSDLDSDDDEDGDDEEDGDSEMDAVDDDFDVLDHTFRTEEDYEGADDVDFYGDTI
ncbi:hypothetical protein V8E53_002295 [Lactarius tabidus]